MESIQAMEPEIDANGNSIGPPPSPLELPFGSKKPFSLAAVTESGSDQTEASSDDAQADQLAKQLSNPVASLISVPFQANEDFGYGPSHNGYKFTLNIQPVIPISISKDWNVIVRTIFRSFHNTTFSTSRMCRRIRPSSRKIVRRTG
jgi:hypothetical protein